MDPSGPAKERSFQRQDAMHHIDARAFVGIRILNEEPFLSVCIFQQQIVRIVAPLFFRFEQDSFIPCDAVGGGVHHQSFSPGSAEKSTSVHDVSGAES